MKALKICCIFGTRPEIIKMAPVIHALQKRSNRVTTHVVCSGQHRELLIPLVEWFELKVDINLDLMQENQDLNSLSSKMLAEFGSLLKRENYDCVVAQGDTTTVLMASIAAFYARIPFAHVEAGLRTFDRNFPYPEEINRVLTGRLAELHFAPTTTAANNLYREGVPSRDVIVTGNTVIDALQYTISKLNEPSHEKKKEKIILVTAHRRENIGEPLHRICRALITIANRHADVSIIFSVHPNPKVKSVVYELLGNIKNITLLDPLPYQKMIELLNKSYLVMTDSGGLQEESPALKKPVLVLREETERPEVVELGGACLVGSDENLIVDTTERLLTDEDEYNKMVIGYSPYGSGDSSELITDQIIKFLSGVSESRESDLVAG